MYSLFKFFFRLGDYYRGLKLFLLIYVAGFVKEFLKLGKMSFSNTHRIKVLSLVKNVI